MTKHGFKNRRQILCMTNVCARSQVTRTALYSCSFKAYEGTCPKESDFRMTRGATIWKVLRANSLFYTRHNETYGKTDTFLK